MQSHGAHACRWLVLASLIFAVALSEGHEAADVDEEAEAAEQEDKNSTQPYTLPNIEGLHWVETFDGDALSRWIGSSKEKYNGRFTVDKRVKEGFIGDLGLVVPNEAQTYGISSKMPALVGAKKVAFVAQFEVRFQEGLQCGGAYVKLFDSKGKQADEFDNETPYVIMFGPDRCGDSNKVHFILQHKNPKTGKWEEKHLEEPPRVPDDRLTHLYGLIINPDNSFEVQVDGVTKASGDLLTKMSPPINPPKDIDDPADSKPSDWIEEAKMNDPAESKPDDWDEDEPYQILDPDSKMPEGWNEEDTKKRLPDPFAIIPADWDEEEDGPWEAPEIDNPACTVGCGPWPQGKMPNPKFKGKWVAPKIDNPEYKGIWSPRQIANPDYFEDETPCVLPKIDSIGIDIWTMQQGIIFDNFVIDTDPTRVAAFTEETWRIRRQMEELQKPKPPPATAMDTLTTYWVPILCSVVIVLLTSMWFCCCRGGGATPPPRRKPVKRAESPTPGSTPAKAEADPAEVDEKKLKEDAKKAAGKEDAKKAAAQTK